MRYKAYELTFWKDINTVFGPDDERVKIFHYRLFDDLVYDLNHLFDIVEKSDRILIRKVIYDDVKGKTVLGDDVKGND